MEYAPSDVFFCLDLQPMVQSLYAEFYQHLRRQGVIVKFFVYDLLCVQHPECFPLGSSQGFANWLQVVGESDGAVCISRTVADDLGEWMSSIAWNRIRPFSIRWNHLGADMCVSKLALLDSEAREDLIPRQLCARPSFLMVGTLEPRKGHSEILDAFESLWLGGSDINLILVGKRGWMVDSLADRLSTHRELGHRLFWLEGISDEYLGQLYGLSSCLIAASYGEGFGLPLIEAAQHGLPIIARDIPVFREVAGDHAFYFASHKASDLALGIQEWLQLYVTDRHPKSDHLPWLTWNQSAAKLLDIITNS
jgi:glycosyltransferase involved in cell wall biosynthesis